MPDLQPWHLLHEDGPCLVVFKPPALLTQAPPGIDNLELRVKRYLQARDGKAHNIYLAVIHRLDRPVSGALVMARHVRAAQRLSEQFEQRTGEAPRRRSRPGATAAGAGPLPGVRCETVLVDPTRAESRTKRAKKKPTRAESRTTRANSSGLSSSCRRTSSSTARGRRASRRSCPPSPSA